MRKEPSFIEKSIEELAAKMDEEAICTFQIEEQGIKLLSKRCFAVFTGVNKENNTFHVRAVGDHDCTQKVKRILPTNISK